MCPDDKHPDSDHATRGEHRELDQLIGETHPGTFSFFGQQARPETPVTATGIEPDRVIDDYRLIALIGQGGMGQVWEAEQLSLRRNVALKLVRPDRISTHTLDLFAREARAGGRLHHAGIVTVIAHGECEGIAWICMELVEGAWTLRDSLKEAAEKTELPPDYYAKVAQFAAELADSLQVAHEAGVIHRDLKPGNVLITSGEHPKISDFGLAKITDETAISQTGEFAGTYFYMSPEQALARRMGIDHRSDIFSLGVVLYEMLALRRPFDGDTGAQVAQQIVTKEAPDLRSIRSMIPWDLAVICGKCLEKDRDRRYETMAELAADIRRHLADEPIHARPPSVWQRTVKWSRRHPAKSASGAVALIAFVLIAILLSINLSMNSKLDASNRDLQDTQRRLADALLMVATLPETQPPSELLIATGESSGAAGAKTDQASGMVLQLNPDQINLASSQEELEAALVALAGVESALTLVPQSSQVADPLDLQHSREGLEAALAVLERVLPGDHPDVLRAQRGLAGLCSALGDLDCAQQLQERVLGSLLTRLPENHPQLIRARNALGVTLSAQGDHERAVELQEAAVAALEGSVPADDPELLAWKGNLAATYHMLSKFADARPLQEELVAIRERILPENDPDLIRARENLTATTIRQRLAEVRLDLEEADLAREEGMPDVARGIVAEALEVVRRLRAVRTQAVLAVLAQIDQEARILEMVRVRLEVGSWIVEHLASTMDESHSALLSARNNLARTQFDAGDYQGARDLWAAVLDVAQRNFSEDHPNVAVSRSNLALALYRLGDYEGARKLQEAVLVAREALPANNSRRLSSLENYAMTLMAMGQIERAREIQEEVFAIREDNLGEDDAGVIRARENFALILYEVGDFEGALELLETVVARREETLPPGDVNLLRARGHLAVMYESLGDLGRARMLQEEALEACLRTLPVGHSLRRTARNNLAVTMFRIGDLEISRELQESVLKEAAGRLDENHPDLLRTRNNLAMTLRVMEDLEGARRILEAVLAVREATLPTNHRDLLGAQGNLALILHDADDFEAARELEETVLAGLEATLTAEHPDVIAARANLGRTLYELGEFERAHELQAVVLQDLQHLPEDHADLLVARAHLAQTTHILGDRPQTAALLDDQLSGIQARFESALTSAAREARVISQEEANHLSGVLFLSESGALDRNAELFSLFETRRHVTTHSSSLVHLQGEETERLHNETTRLSVDLNDLVLAGPAEGQETEVWRAAIMEASIARDRAQELVFEAVYENDGFVRAIQAARLAEKLPAGSVAVGYQRYDRWQFDEGRARIEYDNPTFLALVLLPDGTVQRVELGGADALTQLIHSWRDAVGKSLRSGTPDQGGGVPSEMQSARELREALLDPVLAVIGEATTLHVCLDDVLHLVPLDALLLEDGKRVGDRYAIRQEISFARLLSPPPPSDAQPSMLAVGNVDFDAAVDEDPAIESQRFTLVPIDASDRTGPWGDWRRLRHTRYEIQDLQDLFEDVFGMAPALLTGDQASKRALRAAVVGKRHIHLATHGWFTPDAVRSLADVKATDPFAQRLNETVRGFAPLTLCGLCLAGANSGRDGSGRLPGLLTAQELSGFDLSACDLAVLSANETNVGVHRAGQGILSLQTALHAAGARTTITSLWSFQDRATGDLMRVFYENLWKRGMGKAEALWQAKREMIDEGLPVETWSGWVLTGDPD